MTNPIDISPVHRKIICDILNEHLPSSVNVWVFGSRADWTTKNSSDLDLALEGESKMDYKIIRALEDAFEDSDLPYTVDIIDMNTINSKFKQIVSKQMIPLSIGNNANNTTDQWRKIQFGNCAELIRDTTSPINLADTPYVGLEHIGEGTLSLIGCGTAKDVTSAKTYFRSGDILFGKLRPYFRKVIHVDFNGICSTDIWVIRPTKGINADFLFYIVASMEFVNFAMQGSIGTKMPRAKWEWVSRYNVNIPHVSKQQNIANILKILDNKIELNKRMSQTLEEISWALFKSWFVDFEPVRAKMDGRWKRGKSLPGLPTHFYDLFPDTLVDSELDEIPEGWKIKKVSDVTQVVGGSTPSTKIKKYWLDGIYNWVTPKDLAKLQTYVLLDTERKITAEGLHQISSGLLQPGTVLLSSRAPIGYLAIAEIPVAINQGFIAMQPLENISNQFLLYWCKTHRNTIMNHANGSVFLEINKKNFRQIPLIEPNIAIMQIFHDIVSLLHKKIIVNEQSTRSIIQLRDILLPRLISGELQVHLPIQGV